MLSDFGHRSLSHRKYHSKGLDNRGVRAQVTGYGGDQLVNRCETFDRHEFRYRYSTWLCHFGKVISQQVGDHQVF